MFVDEINAAMACISWLQYLNEEKGLEVILGTDPVPMIEMAKEYDVGGPLSYFAEAPLMGTPGLDLSVQYPAWLFENDNPLADSELLGAEGEFLHQYAGIIKEFAPDLLEACFTHLEADTSLGSASRVATFINLPGASSQLLPKLMELRGESGRTEAIEKLLSSVEHTSFLWHVGFMDSREEKPIRLTLYISKPGAEGLELLKETAKTLGCKGFLRYGMRRLEQVNKFGLFSYIMDIDVMPNGTVGDVVGVELLPREEKSFGQQMMMATDAYKEFVALLKKWDLADSRIDCLPNAVWAQNAPDPQQPIYYMKSYISHFKLRWNKGKAMPIKVYLREEPQEKQMSINQVIAIHKNK